MVSKTGVCRLLRKVGWKSSVAGLKNLSYNLRKKYRRKLKSCENSNKINHAFPSGKFQREKKTTKKCYLILTLSDFSTTSTPLRSVELSKEIQWVHDCGESVILTLSDLRSEETLDFIARAGHGS